MPQGAGADVLVANAFSRKIIAIEFRSLVDSEPSLVLGSNPFPIFLDSPGQDLVLLIHTLLVQDIVGKHILCIVTTLKYEPIAEAPRPTYLSSHCNGVGRSESRDHHKELFYDFRDEHFENHRPRSDTPLFPSVALGDFDRSTTL